MESIEQTTNGSVGSGSRVTSTISRNGDLVYRLFYEIEKTYANTVVIPDNFGAAVFDNVEIEIGGQRIDRQTGKWMNIWSLLTQSNDSRLTGNNVGGGGTLFQELAVMGGCCGAAASGSTTVSASVPLQFWFCRNPGLALPLIALQYHEVKVVTTFTTEMASATAKLWADYIYLDTDERRRFAQVSHEYLIEQVQFQAGAGNTSSTELNFNHPVKELVWAKKGATLTSDADLVDGNYQLKLNGHDRFAARPRKYFTKQQVWMHHTGPGGVDVVTGGNDGGEVGAGCHSVAVYSFALKPEEHQPSGTCNFSRIDNAQLTCDASAEESRDVYAVNYNVLRIMSGMGGLAYSN